MRIFSFLSYFLAIAFGCQSKPSKNMSNMDSTAKSAQSIYDFTMKSIDGKDIKLSDFKGKPLIIVNTASKCGYTKQYKVLQEVHEQYGDKITILGFPANNFGGQEPGSNEEIANFCQVNYGVSFQMFEKISVKGDDQHPLYQWLSNQVGAEPSWNFCKYLIDENGQVKKFYNSSVSPAEIAVEALKL
jgi:glutathione peroxidase